MFRAPRPGCGPHPSLLWSIYNPLRTSLSSIRSIPQRAATAIKTQSNPVAPLKCLVVTSKPPGPGAPLLPALPRRGGEGVCTAGSPVGPHLPQPSGRCPNARATPRCNSHLSSSTPFPDLSAPHQGETPTAQPARPAATRTPAAAAGDQGGAGGASRVAATPALAGSHRNRPAHDLPPTTEGNHRNTRHPAPGCAAPEKRPGEDPALTLKAGSLPSAARCSSRTSSMAFSQNMVPAPGPLDHRLSTKGPPHCSLRLLLLLFPGARSADPASARFGAKMATNRSALPASGLRWRPGDICLRGAAAVPQGASQWGGCGPQSGFRPTSLSRPRSKLRLSGRTALTQPNSGWAHARSSVGFSHSHFG